MEKVEEGAVETDEAFHWRNRKKKKTRDNRFPC